MNGREINVGKNLEGAKWKIGESIVSLLMVGAFWLSFTARMAWGQVDQGAITGVVQDATGAVISAAQVALTDTDTGLILKGKANGSGIYMFSPIKQGNYSLGATAPGFQTTVQQNIHLDIQQRLNIVLTLHLEWYRKRLRFPRLRRCCKPNPLP